MANVSVKDVAEIRYFSVGVQTFNEEYMMRLNHIESAVQADMYTARNLLKSLKAKVEHAAAHLSNCRQSLQNYLASNSGHDREGNPVEPDPCVVRQLREAVEAAEIQLHRARSNYEKGKESERKVRVALDEVSAAVSSGRCMIRDEVMTACSAIDRAADHIETYKS